jgi:excisionase family DNA binding protein
LSGHAGREANGPACTPACINIQMDAAMPKPSASGAPSNPPNPLSRLAYGIEDAAASLGLSRSRLYELIAAGEIAACKVGKRTIIPATELTTFLDRHRVAGLSGQRAGGARPFRSQKAGAGE